MAFASRCGLAIVLDDIADDPLATMFAEELGAVVQVRVKERSAVMDRIAGAGLAARVVGVPSRDERIRIITGGEVLFDESCVDLHLAWSSTTHALQRLRDNPVVATEEHARIQDTGDPGLSPKLTFDHSDDVAGPFIATGARPKIAILREQGVNGQVEMAAAFDRAGFDPYDVHMTDIIAGRRSLAEFKGFVGCGGFSYGDVLGAGEGWAKSILFNGRA